MRRIIKYFKQKFCKHKFVRSETTRMFWLLQDRFIAKHSVVREDEIKKKSEIWYCKKCDAEMLIPTK